MTTDPSTSPDVDFPPVVYIPTTTGPGGETRVEYQHLTDGRLGLFSYSAIDRLHERYGPGTPWLLVTVEHLQQIHDQAPYDALFLDARPGRADTAP